MKTTLEVLEAKRDCLEDVAESYYPINWNLREAHNRKVNNAKNFINELNQIIYEVDLLGDTKYKVVPKSTLNKEIKKSDFAEVEFDGVYCQMVWIKNYKDEEMVLIYTAPISCL